MFNKHVLPASPSKPTGSPNKNKPLWQSPAKSIRPTQTITAVVGEASTVLVQSKYGTPGQTKQSVSILLIIQDASFTRATLTVSTSSDSSIVTSLVPGQTYQLAGIAPDNRQGPNSASISVRPLMMSPNSPLVATLLESPSILPPVLPPASDLTTFLQTTPGSVLDVVYGQVFSCSIH